MAGVFHCKPSLALSYQSLQQAKFACVTNFHRPSRRPLIRAIFWGRNVNNAVEINNVNFPSKELELKESTPNSDLHQNPSKAISIFVVSSIAEVSPSDWDACNLESTSPEDFNPFLSHAFFSSLEESCSAVKETGWIPCHVVAKDEEGNVTGVIPLYLKSHSYGEYVFDHSWAEAYYSYGGRYYPKFQSCVPFTPVTGPRILIRRSPYRNQIFKIMVAALKNLTVKSKVSSLHVTFSSEEEWDMLKEEGFLQRKGMQYHWENRNYKTFDEFLMDMKQNKRKNIRQERKKIADQNLKMKRLRGNEITAKHWDLFYMFYRNTTDNKWGTPYLTREFFHILGSKMKDKVLLVIAEDEEDRIVAGALNLIGGSTLYGRHWGCHPNVFYLNLHFEACYYQAIEGAIEMGLKRVEAGAQGEHKIQRGYLPVTTYSCHFVVDDAFKMAIEKFLVKESKQVDMVIKMLHDSSPFKDR